MTRYVTTDTILDKILATKVEELDRARRLMPMAMVAQAARIATPPCGVVEALTERDTVALIAEVKHASPSRGVLIEPFEPLTLAKTYAANGAAMISVLTDETYFQGHIDHLRAIRRARRAVNVPLLRKEFIIDTYQVYESRSAGADAILLIVAALEDDQMRDLLDLTHELGMTALIEVHNEAELERALKQDVKVIGVNNRDLRTFSVDLETTERMAKLVPEGTVLVAESGLKTPLDVHRAGKLGAQAVLIGEGIVTASDIAATVRALSQQGR